MSAEGLRRKLKAWRARLWLHRRVRLMRSRRFQDASMIVSAAAELQREQPALFSALMARISSPQSKDER